MSLIFEKYNNVKIKQEFYKKELQNSKDKLEEIHQKYLGGANQFAERVKGGKSINPTEDAQIAYIDEVNYKAYMNIENTMYSLTGYIEALEKLIKEQDDYLNFVEDKLRKLDGREYELFYLIKVDGYKPTQAVETLAKKYEIEPRSVWRKEYKNIKRYIYKYK